MTSRPSDATGNSLSISTSTHTGMGGPGASSGNGGSVSSSSAGGLNGRSSTANSALAGILEEPHTTDTKDTTLGFQDTKGNNKDSKAGTEYAIGVPANEAVSVFRNDISITPKSDRSLVSSSPLPLDD
jgi:hypothetical protein